MFANIKTTRKGGENMNKKGFTLVELLVVIVIIGILATLATVALSSARLKARDARRISDVKQIQTALELYYNDTQKYPDYKAAPAANGSLTFGEALKSSDGTTIYMAKVPTDPSGASNEDACVNTTRQAYAYTTMAQAAPYSSRGYVIRYCLGSLTSDIPAGTHCASLEGISNTGTFVLVNGACPYSASQNL